MPWSRIFVTVALAGVLTACGGDVVAPPTGIVTGTIRVTTTTTGGALDADGYMLTLDQEDPRPIGLQETTLLDAVAAGTHRVRLSGNADNCAVTEPNPAEVAVPAGGSIEVGFEVACTAPGSAIISVATDGVDIDSDGYDLSLDGGAAQPVGSNATSTIAGLLAGTHTVKLSALSVNCGISGANPVTLTVQPAQTAVVEFRVTCHARISNAILFSSSRSSSFPLHHVLRMRPDGAEVVDLTPDTDGEDARWSPDGSRIAFTSYRDGNAEIYTMFSDGSGATRLTQNPAYDKEPVWSPDGDRIAFLRTGAGETSVHIINADGSGDRSIAGTSNGHAPSWSPDGSTIAFIGMVQLCNFDVCGADVLTVATAGGSTTNLTQNAVGGVAGDPAWSPDGSRIAYSQNGQLYTIGLDGAGPTRISRDPAAEDGAPVWSPDGTRLAFTRYLDDAEVFVMNADGSGATNISRNPASDAATSWR
jgi:TolB protein